MAGTTEKRGARGLQGERGERGQRGVAGPMASRAQILAAVQNEFLDLRKHLQLQIERTAQMQQQLDTIHKLLVKSLGES